MSKLGVILRAGTTLVRTLQFAIAALVLGIFSWFLACLYSVPSETRDAQADA